MAITVYFVRYVPVKTSENGDKEIIVPLKKIGDLMTEERIYNIKKPFRGGETSYTRLEGINPAFADWHLVKTLYEVPINNIIFVIATMSHITF